MHKTNNGRWRDGHTRNPCGRIRAMFEGPAMVVMWLITPALVVIGSFGAGLAFHSISKLWPAEPEGDASERT
jgi:hypothetical protein